MAIILSNNVNAVANSDQTENGLKFLLEYLQLSLPIDCPLSGSITSLILREATLPSRSFLKEVSQILKLQSLSTLLQDIINIPLRNWIQASPYSLSGKIKKSSTAVSSSKIENELGEIILLFIHWKPFKKTIIISIGYGGCQYSLRLIHDLRS